MKHGMSKTKFYKNFHKIKARCYNKKHHKYSIYGGRGIVCEWKNFENFFEDMYESYLKHVRKFGEHETTIDRIDMAKRKGSCEVFKVTSCWDKYVCYRQTQNLLWFFVEILVPVG
jgi:hypothetical protein